MQLFFSPTSPYARKVRAAAISLGIETDIELLPANPLDDPEPLLAANPLGKVPTLVAGDGTVLVDSLVICQYLYARSGRGAEVQSIDLLNRHALANGIIDAALAVVMERRREDAAQSGYWVDRWTRSIERSIKAVETPEPGSLSGLVEITLAVALEYLDFRDPVGDWRRWNPALAGWLADAAGQAELARTRPT